ncbi:2-hydroxyacid dehydrogenase [Thalassotalea profundi]|uniref:Glyoxylate/hydroxypyruvate reductase A n=1 Tax=Thalassotalea profundi TaxID=2036687 RepID=A0ABQ3IAR6_9GAMM|nr:glyoxylate/hydroxypyruvate reductase A [Thalassotalea profundi]GHE77218.1 glyoxylate/hydroxypyruvate reductase A [Thalassotalea profundi]
MTAVIPLISQLPESEKEQWLIHLNRKLDPHKVVLSDDMSHQEKLGVKVAIVANPEPMKVLEFPSLVWVQSLWAGVDRLLHEIPLPTCKVARLEDPYLADTMAEAVLTWTLYLHRDIPQYAAQQKRNEWLQHKVLPASTRNISILGLGNLGQVSAERLKTNGFNVSGWSLSPKVLPGITCYHGEAALTEMLAKTHILVILLPLTGKTDKLVDQDLLSKLPKGAQIINFARGKIIDINALVSALDNNHLKHAVLDVFEQEPLPIKDSLWCHEKITILPHISAPTNLISASEIVKNNIFNYLHDGILPRVVDINRAY